MLTNKTKIKVLFNDNKLTNIKQSFALASGQSWQLDMIRIK